jgi:two-component system, cell cycle sensor histidine kinase and response regulator CckA
MTMEQPLPEAVARLFPEGSEQQLEEQLRQAQRLEAVGQLAGGIAHDFRNLLTAIRGYADLVRRNLGPDDRNRADLDQVVLAADRATELTGQLLAFSRRQVLQPRIVDPAEVVMGVAPMLRRLLGEHIELVIHAAPDLERVRADPSQLEQIIVNLAVNARDAMPGGGTLTIETANVDLDAEYSAVHADVVPGPYLALIVSDTGTGMDASTSARVFEPFFTTKAPGIGTGMGLATVRGIVQQSGGSIFVYSEPGFGTSFKVYLPRVADEAAPDPRTVPREPAPTGSETILLVEDEEVVRAYAMRILSELGYTVIEASTGTEALAMGATHTGAIDLLVTDVVLPGPQGYQLGRQLRSLRPGLRVLYISGFTENSLVHHGVADEAVAFLQKPFSGEALGWAARQALDRPA